MIFNVQYQDSTILKETLSWQLSFKFEFWNTKIDINSTVCCLNQQLNDFTFIAERNDGNNGIAL